MIRFINERCNVRVIIVICRDEESTVKERPLQDDADISVVLFLGGKGGGLGFASIADNFASDDWEVDWSATAGSDCTRATASTSSAAASL